MERVPTEELARLGQAQIEQVFAQTDAFRKTWNELQERGRDGLENCSLLGPKRDTKPCAYTPGEPLVNVVADLDRRIAALETSRTEPTVPTWRRLERRVAAIEMRLSVRPVE